MDTINNLELRNENLYPDDLVLKKILGKSYEVYKNLLKLYKKYEMNCEWRYYNDGKAWLCKVQKKKKTIVWMSAWNGYMEVAIYYPVRLLETVLALDISNESKENITNTKNVGKTKPCIFKVHSNEILIDFEKVMMLKISGK